MYGPSSWYMLAATRKYLLQKITACVAVSTQPELCTQSPACADTYASTSAIAAVWIRLLRKGKGKFSRGFSRAETGPLRSTGRLPGHLHVAVAPRRVFLRFELLVPPSEARGDVGLDVRLRNTKCGIHNCNAVPVRRWHGVVLPPLHSLRYPPLLHPVCSRAATRGYSTRQGYSRGFGWRRGGQRRRHGSREACEM